MPKNANLSSTHVIHISTEEARRKNLPGSDTYSFSDLMYHDEINRDFGVIHLNREALKAFMDTTTISERHALVKEQIAAKEWLERGGFMAGLDYPFGAASMRSMEYVNYENLKIASAFEIHLKARLLYRDYIVHEIDESISGCERLAKHQKKRPILKSELISIHGYKFDGNINYLPGLKETSLKFSLLIEKPRYIAALNLEKYQVDLVEKYRKLRNQIHLPMPGSKHDLISSYPSPVFGLLTDFINTELIDWTNELTARHNFKYGFLERLT